MSGVTSPRGCEGGGVGVRGCMGCWDQDLMTGTGGKANQAITDSAYIKHLPLQHYLCPYTCIVYSSHTTQ